ncbi:hypothetical protein GCM10010885_15240 [Alicyclobacillus cellulosilyticus]|uniref:DUF2249 domain-containing protein n=1 Tax=Alicyclobacillus cellulosilyticus TaxID=1003997 RepID=A0A917NK24_9BACL|nr:DUF2249 domain-containing protein [Alicyclobacillus cellulosilyticus]GGJ07019.1 hypothetical protein GCM10010885_15240 [Alicyclobacillus cellulosilyticus]
MESYAATLDVRQFPPPAKHKAILAVWDALAAGKQMLIVNDHDPKPLYYQFAAEFPGQFDWTYLEEGPERWQVAIAKRG